MARQVEHPVTKQILEFPDEATDQQIADSINEMVRPAAPAAPTVWDRLAAVRRGVTGALTPTWQVQRPGALARGETAGDIPYVSAPMRAAVNLVNPIPTSAIEAGAMGAGLLAGPAAPLVGRALPAAGRALGSLAGRATGRIAAQAAGGAAGGALGEEGATTGALIGGGAGALGEGVVRVGSALLRHGPGSAKRMAERAMQGIGAATEKIAPTLPRFRATKEALRATDIGEGGASATEALGQGWTTGMEAVQRGLGDTKISVPTLADPEVQAFLRNPRSVAGMDAEGVAIPASGQVTVGQLNDAIKLIGSMPVFGQAPQGDVIRRVHALYGKLVNEAREGIRQAEASQARAAAMVVPQAQPVNRGLALPPAPAERTFQAGAPAPPVPPRQPLALPEVTGAPPGGVTERTMRLPAIRPGGPPGRPRTLREVETGPIPAEVQPIEGREVLPAAEAILTGQAIPEIPAGGVLQNVTVLGPRVPTGPSPREYVGPPERPVKLRGRLVKRNGEMTPVEAPTGAAPVADVTPGGAPPTREYIGPEVQVRAPEPPPLTEYPLADLWDRTRQEFKMGKNVQELLEAGFNPARVHGPEGYLPPVEVIQERLAQVAPQEELRRYIGQGNLEELGRAATFGQGLGAKNQIANEAVTPWEERMLGTGLLGLLAGGAGFTPGYGISGAMLGTVAGRRFLLPNWRSQYAHAPGQLPYTLGATGQTGVDLGLLRAIEQMRSQQREEEPLP